MSYITLIVPMGYITHESGKIPNFQKKYFAKLSLLRCNFFIFNIKKSIFISNLYWHKICYLKKMEFIQNLILKSRTTYA